MLAQPRWRATSIRHISRRLQSTLSQTEAGTSASSPSPPSDTAPRLRRQRRRNQGTIFIRPWDGVNSMPEALAIVRGVEKKYGKIQDFMLMRDFDNPESYQPYFWAEFKDEEVLQQIPKEPSILQVKVPIIDKTQPGGIGLSDLQGLLDSVDKVDDAYSEYQTVASRMKPENSTDDASTRVIDVRIERTNKTIWYKVAEEYPNFGRKRILSIGQAFSQWGGFYTPTEALSHPLTEEEIEDQHSPVPSTFLTQPRMRRAQQAWGKLLSGAGTPLHETEASVAEGVDVELDGLPGDTLPPVLEATEIPVEEEPTQTQTEHASAVGEIDVAPPSSPPEAEAPAPLTQILTRRQRLLAQARENARTPLPEALLPPTPEEIQAKAEAKEGERKKEEKEASSMRERLWKLMGGRWV